MNYTKLLLIFSLFTYSFCSKSNPSQDDQSPVDDREIEEDDGKEDLILASFLYEKFKYTFDLAHNPEYLQDTSEKPLTFNFVDIEEEDDWKVVAKIKGNFAYSNGDNLEIDLQLLKYGVVGPDDTINDENKDDVIQLSTVEVSSVKSPYRVLVTCTDCEELLEQIGEANDGLHITEDVMTYDTIGANVHDNEDGTFTMSMIVLLYNDMDYSEMTSMYDDDIDQLNESGVSEKDIDVDVTLKQFINTKFNKNLEAAQMIQQVNESHTSQKFLV